MAKYDVHAFGDGFLLDVQDDYLSALNTRIVVPLLPKADAALVSEKLNPVFVVNGEEMVMETHLLAAVPVASLGRPVGSLVERFDEITRALDFAFHGF